MVANQKVKRRNTAEVDEIEDTEDFSDKEMREREINDTNESLYNGNSVSNAGWADAMQKILKTTKPKRKKTIVLSKAKKLCVIKTKDTEENISFEIDGEAKNETKTKSEVNTKIEKISQSKQKSKEKNPCIRIKPSITDRTHEKMLQKIATKGVVQLFNAVRQQQTTISKKVSEAGPLERKREEALKNINKNTFLDLLMGNSKSISVKNTDKIDKSSAQQTNYENKDHKIWSVLRDDFIMKARLKDWDKKEDVEEDSSAPEELDDDDDDVEQN